MPSFRWTLVALATVVAAPGLSAQVSVGVTAGLHVASWDSEDDLAESARLRFVGGLAARVKPIDWVGVQAEVLYAQKGSQFEDESIRYRADYIEFPVLLVLDAPLVRSLDTSMLVGPAVAIPLGGTADVEAIGEQPATEVDLNLQTDVGAVVGADIGAGPFGVGLRYTHGLRNVIEGENVVPWKHRVVGVTARYRFTPSASAR